MGLLPVHAGSRPFLQNPLYCQVRPALAISTCMLSASRAIVAESYAIRQVLSQIEQVAPTPATVLMLGETGTGKEVMAQAIHDFSPRRQRRMVRVNCAAIPTALIESELFGRERSEEHTSEL